LMVGNPPILRIPAQVGSTTLDALGNPLEYRGSAYPALPQKVQSVAGEFDGTTQYITMASLTGSETVTSWGGTGTEPTISAGRIDFTAGSYWELTLSTGVSIPFNNSGAYDLASDGTLVEYINNPSVVRQDVYHAEMDNGYREYADTDNGNARVAVPLVNGSPVDETNKPTGWVFVKDVQPAGTGHNGADTGLNLTHLTPTGDRTPALTASGQDIQNYQFGDTLVNPAFKRVVSADYEDRHSVFQEPLTGACLGKAQDFFSVPDGFTYSFPIQLS